MYASILVEIKLKAFDKTYTYHVPDELKDKIALGDVVKVPFGKKNVEGYVLELQTVKPDFETRDVLEIVSEKPVLNEEMLKLGEYLKTITVSSLSACYAAMLPKALKAKEGVKVNKKYLTYLELNKDFNLNYLTPIQQKIIDLFYDKTKILKKEVMAINQSSVRNLIQKGVLIESKEEVARYNLEEKEDSSPKILNAEQLNAISKVQASFGIFKTFLLHGVTGSGKTEVYLQLINEVLKINKTAIVLVPEISLTPQFIKRFNARFYHQIAVFHSQLNDGERYDEWRKIEDGQAKIVIGARSAIFAPLKNLGLIILDEEHSDSYKQENNPKYQALKIAQKRCEYWSCPLLLGSATPSLDSMARAMKHVYEYLPMTKRASGALPFIKLVDMAKEAKKKRLILSEELELEIQKRLDNHEQVVLLLNRRGHSTFITCSSCGYTYKCPYCDISLTYHKSSKHLRCHYCGYTKFVDDNCPICHDDALNYLGLGTEKLEETIKKTFPLAKVVRMDADSTVHKNQLLEITNDFYQQKYDILLGTQMVSKGLDFPNVTLVGIISADASLAIPDYKSNERTFSLLVQASGRAGRSNKPGQVIIQTYNPHHPILMYAKDHNYQQYYLYEMKMRKLLKYPPYYYLVQIKLKGKKYNIVNQEILKAKAFLKQNLHEQTIVLGPALSNPFLVGGVYSFELLIKYRYDDKLLNTLQELDKIYISNNDVFVDIDLSY